MRRLGRLLLSVAVLTAVAYAAWGLLESRRLAAAIADVTTTAEGAASDDKPRALTSEQQDAARIYAAAVDRLQDETRDDASRYRSVDVDNLPAAAASLDELEARYPHDAASLQLLDQATPLEFAGFGQESPELARNQDALAGLSARNALRADLLSIRGRGDAAAQALVASVRLQRTIPGSFLRYLASNRLLGSVRILLRHTRPHEPALSALQRAFESLPDTDTLVSELVRSRAEFIDSATGPARAPGEAISSIALRPLIARETRRQLGYFTAARTLIDLPWPEKYDRAAAFEQQYLSDARTRRGGALLERLASRRGYGFGGTSVYAAAIDLAARRIAVSAIAVERFRRTHGEALPPALTALVPAYLGAVRQDPFSGRALVYTRDAAEYRIYSVDRDRNDDGGMFYGVGSGGQRQPLRDAPRDYGVRVRLRADE